MFLLINQDTSRIVGLPILPLEKDVYVPANNFVFKLPAHITCEGHRGSATNFLNIPISKSLQVHPPH